MADGNADFARKRVDDCAEQARLRADRDARALSVLRDELQRLEREAAPRLALRRHLEGARGGGPEERGRGDVAEDAWIDARGGPGGGAAGDARLCARAAAAAGPRVSRGGTKFRGDGARRVVLYRGRGARAVVARENGPKKAPVRGYCVRAGFLCGARILEVLRSPILINDPCVRALLALPAP